MPSIEGGGVEKNFFLISNYLSKNIGNIIVVSISRKYKNKFNKNIKFVSLKFDFWDNLTRRFKFFLAIILLIKEVFKNKNSVVVSFQANIYCGLLSKLLGFNLIIRSNSSPKGWSQNFVKNFFYKIALNAAKKIIVNSQEFRKEIKNRFNVSSECIYNPLNKTEILKLSRKKIKFKFFTKDNLNIINIGRIENQKDQKSLLEAIKILNKKIKIKLLIIGNGSIQKELERFIINNSLEKSVKILNNISNPFPYLLKSDLFILSSIYEGLPNVLLESLILKKFIISTNCSSGPSEILDYGKGGILTPVGDYHSLAKKIIYFKKNKKKLKHKLVYARKRLYRFDENKNLIKYSDLIKKNI
tara:strand:- start:32768 stop:33838 length:1071 start_codon:yes stop_codon:yes gene_type:complete